MEQKIHIRATHLSDSGVLIRLYHALSKNYNDNFEALRSALESPNTFIFTGLFDNKIVATATLSIRGVPSAGLVGYIDDVIVDPEFRGHGFGRALIEHCINQSKEKNCVRLELTSNSEREAANNLYSGLGFKTRETNNYVLKF